jgi:hypothetical protein
MTDNIELVKKIDHYKNVKSVLEKKIEELKAVLDRYQHELEVAESRILKADEELKENKNKR